MTVSLNSLFLFISVLLIFFLEVLSYSFVCKVFCLFILPNSLCVYFYLLDISTTFPSLERVASCRICPLRPSGTIPYGHFI